MAAADPRPVLVCASAFGDGLHASRAAARIARGLEEAGLSAEACPVADGGPGTLEVLLTALGGRTEGATIGAATGAARPAGFGLLEDGALALAETPREAEGRPTSEALGELVAAAAAAGPAVVVLAAGGYAAPDAGEGAARAIERGGGLRGARLVVLRRDRPAIPAQDGGLAATLTRRCGAVIEHGAPFVLGAIGFDERMRRARAVIVAEEVLELASLEGGVTGEAATRARQAGVPCHAIAGRDDLDLLSRRILDLQVVLTARGAEELVAAGASLGRMLAAGEA